jgi:O-succinylbenzoate synthase
VIIKNIRAFQYNIPFKSPLKVTGQALQYRQGLIVALENDEGITGYGEIAPLEGLHNESLEDCIQQLRSIKPLMLPKTFDYEDNTHSELILNWLDSYQLYPSVHFGLDMASVQLTDLIDSTFSSSQTISVPVNALLEADMAIIEDQAAELLEQGYQTIKLKVGRQSLEHDLECVKRLQHIGGEKLRLRLDANRLWPYQTALAFAKGISTENIEYIEEPVNNPEDLAKFQRETDLPVALDETLAEHKNQLKKLPFSKSAAFIIKPSVLGNLSHTFSLRDFALRYNIKCVITSAFETGLTHRFYAWLASLGTSSVNASGLDTISYLSSYIIIPPFTVSQGMAEVSHAQLIRPNILFNELRELTL